jgi:hypothetical protein
MSTQLTLKCEQCPTTQTTSSPIMRREQLPAGWIALNDGNSEDFEKYHFCSVAHLIEWMQQQQKDFPLHVTICHRSLNERYVR